MSTRITLVYKQDIARQLPVGTPCVYTDVWRWYIEGEWLRVRIRNAVETSVYIRLSDLQQYITEEDLNDE